MCLATMTCIYTYAASTGRAVNSDQLHVLTQVTRSYVLLWHIAMLLPCNTCAVFLSLTHIV